MNSITEQILFEVLISSGLWAEGVAPTGFLSQVYDNKRDEPER